MALYRSSSVSEGGGSFVPEGKMLTQSARDIMIMAQESEIGETSFYTMNNLASVSCPTNYHWLNPDTDVVSLGAVALQSGYQKLKINLAVLKNGVVTVKGSNWLTTSWIDFNLSYILGDVSDADAIVIFMEHVGSSTLQYSLRRQ